MTESAREEHKATETSSQTKRRRRNHHRSQCASAAGTKTPPTAPASATTDAATTDAAMPTLTTTDATTTSAAITGVTATDASTAGIPTPATVEAAATKAADEHKQSSSAEDAPYAIMSTRATGIHPKMSRPVNLGVPTADSSDNIVDAWHIVISPTESPGLTHLHGPEPTDFEGAPKFRMIQAKLTHMLDGRTLVAHNASLVQGFIVAEAKRARRQTNRG